MRASAAGQQLRQRRERRLRIFFDDDPGRRRSDGPFELRRQQAAAVAIEPLVVEIHVHQVARENHQAHAPLHQPLDRRRPARPVSEATFASTSTSGTSAAPGLSGADRNRQPAARSKAARRPNRPAPENRSPIQTAGSTALRRPAAPKPSAAHSAQDTACRPAAGRLCSGRATAHAGRVASRLSVSGTSVVEPGRQIGQQHRAAVAIDAERGLRAGCIVAACCCGSSAVRWIG